MRAIPAFGHRFLPAALLAASLLLAGGCAGESDRTGPTPTDSPEPSETEAFTDEPTEEPTDEPTEEDVYVPDVDGLCEDAMAAIDDVPTGGFSSDDFAREEQAVAQILWDLSSALSDAGAGDLADATATYADSRAALAVAYDQDLTSAVDAATADVEAAASEMATVASSAGAYGCVALAEN